MGCDSVILKRHGNISIDSQSSTTLVSCKILQHFSTWRCYGESGKCFTPFIKAFTGLLQDKRKTKYYWARKVILDQKCHQTSYKRKKGNTDLAFSKPRYSLFCPLRNEILQLNQCIMGGTPQKGIVVILYLHQCPWGHSHWIISNSSVWCRAVWWM